MLKIRYLRKFKRDLKRLQKQGKDIEKLKTVIRLLCEGKELPTKYVDHPLKNYENTFSDSRFTTSKILTTVFLSKERAFKSPPSKVL